MDIQDAYDWNQLLKGDKVAFEKLYFRYINALYAYGVRLCRHETLVEDCLQDLFSDLWEKRRKLGPITSVKAYLFVSVKRRILRKLTCEQRRNTEELRDLAAEWPFLPDIGEQESSEKTQLLQQAFRLLSPKQQEVIYLRYYNQLSYEETAEVMEVQTKAVYKLMARAIQSLRSEMCLPQQQATLLAILAMLCK